MKLEHSDIVIVGGGLAGLTMALALKDFPGSITLIEAVQPERQIEADYDARSIALAHGNRAFLQELGVWQMIVDKVTPIWEIQVSDQRHFGKSRLSAHDEQVPALGYVIEIPYLYNGLLEAIKTIKNFTHRYPAKVIGLSRCDKHWVLQLQQGTLQTELTSQAVIAADGIHSTIRQLLNLDSHIKDYQQQAIITNVSVKAAPKYTAFERFTAHGPMGLLPLSQSRAALIWVKPVELAPPLLQLSETDFIQSLHEQFGYYAGEFIHVGTRKCYPLKSNWLAEPIQQQCVFIGNAAHTLHPIAGQGFNLSLRDIKVLAPLIRANPTLEQHVFQQYATLRQSQQQRLLQFTDLMVHVFSNTLGPIAKLRNLALNGLNHSRLAKHLFIRYMMGLDG